MFCTAECSVTGGPFEAAVLPISNGRSFFFSSSFFFSFMWRFVFHSICYSAVCITPNYRSRQRFYTVCFTGSAFASPQVRNSILIVLGFNDTSSLVGHFVSSPRKEKRDRRDSRRDEREEQGRKRNRDERGETEEIKTFPLYLYLLQG